MDLYISVSLQNRSEFCPFFWIEIDKTSLFHIIKNRAQIQVIYDEAR